MCWACYTPLSGAPTNASGAIPTVTNPSARPEGIKKPIPAWQIAVLGIAIVGGVGYGAMSLMGGSAVNTDATAVAPATTEAPATVSTTPAAKPTTTVTVNVPTVSNPSAPPAPAAVVPARAVTATGQMRFLLGAPPKRGVAWGSMAIVPTEPSISAQDAAGLAATATRQMIKTGRWEGLYVYVFQDSDSAQKFRRYQKDRGGQPLEDSDFNALQDLWPNTLLRYDYSRGMEALRYPSKNPSSWWSGKPKFDRART